MVASSTLLDMEFGDRARAAPRMLSPGNGGRWIAIGLIGLAVAWVVYQILVNPGFQWPVVADFMLDPTVLEGVGMTIKLTILVMMIGMVIGVPIAVMNVSQSRLLKLCGGAFIWFFRGVPPLVQLVFWYNLASLFPDLMLGIPFGGPKFFSVSSTDAISSFGAAMLGLGLVEAAYMAEIVRGGLVAVDPGQVEASKALGHGPFQTLRMVILPQAMKVIIPPTGNQFIGALKFTSLASVAALGELMHSVELVYSNNFQIVPLLIVAALWYVIMVSILTVGQHFLERHYSRGFRQKTMGAGA
ncbi:amino acid ABC transporter permease [Sphingobium sp.]|uniref:amino acid ABC transporter permease n=1 Tax=Sphingobium sp. TaxID=1912891 RepID=UPI00262F5754|nr:amino acid ABC transporter permease [Sphingobium sp.]